MDTAWDGIATAVMRPVLGPLTDYSRVQRIPDERTPSFDPGWYGYVSKDLRTELGMKVRGPYSRRYCGNGSLKACRNVAVGGDPGGGEQAHGHPGLRTRISGTRAPPQDRISFIPGLIPFTMRWTNRSTFQQVIEFTGHAKN